MNTAFGTLMARPPCVILRSKVTPQAAKVDTNLRPRLMEALAGLGSSSLMLIQAPAGYGKTTLLKQFYQQLGDAKKPVAWLSLYPSENEPARAIAHIVAAFGVLDEEIDRQMEPYFSAIPPYPIEDVVASLIHSLERFKSGVTLILDDYHEITSDEVHKAVFFFLSNLPPNVNCIIASRARPPFEFRRLELRGSVTTLNRDDLQFTRDEIVYFLKSAGGIDLDSESLELFASQTEGWITAIKLALTTMEGKSDNLCIQKLVSGTQYALVDYLTEAVINRYDEKTRQFLMQTAPLGRINPELCNAVTGMEDAAEQLDKLARENLFITALDEQGKWYRYHSLFSEFLCGLLARDSTLSRQDIHKRASQWYDRNDIPEDAVEHAVASGDLDYATKIIQARVQELTRTGQITRLLGWLNQLPTAALNSSPKLLIHLGWCQALSHLTKDAAHTISLVEKFYRQGADNLKANEQSQRQEALAELRIIDQCSRRLSGESWVDSKPLLSLKDTIDPKWSFIRAELEFELGYVYLFEGKLENAHAAFQDAHAFSQAVPNALLVNLSVHMMASVRRLQGRFKECEDLCREGIKLAQRDNQYALPVVGRFHLTLAEILYESNDLDNCQIYLEKAIGLLDLSGDPELLTESEILAAKLLGVKQGVKAVIDRLYEAERLVSRRASSNLLKRIRAHQVWYLIEYRDLVAAEAIIRQCEMPIDKPRPTPSFAPDPDNEFYYLALCRYWVATKSYTQAGFWLRHLVKSAEWAQRVVSATQFNALHAVMLSKQGQPDAAARLVRDIVHTAADRRLARSIVGMGDDFTALLDNFYRLRSSAPSVDPQEPVISHMHKLMDIVRGGEPVITTTQSAPAKPSNVGRKRAVNALTPRELQVLEQVARGLKNREVAEELLIAESSVQWHIKNLYAKLDVHNRTEASAKARELNLIR